MKKYATKIQEYPLCEKKLAGRLWRRQHNGRWLWTTGSERRTPFATSDDTSRETTVVLGLQQVWSNAKSNRRPY